MSDIVHPNCQLDNRYQFKTLSDKSTYKDHLKINQIENINFEIINKDKKYTIIPVKQGALRKTSCLILAEEQTVNIVNRISNHLI